jgi:hypothetical protein
MRPTTKTTIGEHTVEHYSYVTPREIHAIRDFQVKNPTEETKANEMLLGKLLVAIDDKKENLVDVVMDSWTLADYTELQQTIANIINPEKKSGSPLSTTATNE